MAFSISDLLSYFSQASDGQRLRGPNEAARDTAAGDPSGILNHVQTTQAPRPVQAAPAPVRQRPRVQPGPIDQAMQMGPSQRPPESLDGVLMGPTMGGPQGSLDGILMGPSQQTPPPLNVESTGPLDPTLGPKQGQPETPQGLAQYEQGILGKIGDAVGPNFIGRLGNAMMVAGSQDPAKALVMLRQQEAEAQEAQAKRAAAGRPKIVPIQGGAFSLVTFPDGSMQSIPNKDVMDFQQRVAEQSRLGKIDQAVLQAHLTQLAGQTKIDDRVAAENRPLLNDTISLRDKYGRALEMIEGQGTWAQVQGIPGISGIAGFFGTDDAAKNKFLQGLAVSETLLNTALTKGAISNQEMTLFKSPIPSLTDDREKVWKPFIQERLPVLQKLEEFQRSEVARGERRADISPAPQAPQAPQGLESQVKASFGSYEPDRYDYRVNPQTGKLQRKLKGQ